jgi:hypothetical protein
MVPLLLAVGESRALQVPDVVAVAAYLTDILGLPMERAQVLAGLETPAVGFGRELSWPLPDGKRRRVWQPRASLTGFEVVVASSNNAAVENVTKELPGRKAIGEDAPRSVSAGAAPGRSAGVTWPTGSRLISLT